MEMESATRDQTLNKAVDISLRANSLGKGINQFVLLLPQVQINNKTVFLCLCLGNQSRRKKTLNSNKMYSPLKKLTLCYKMLFCVEVGKIDTSISPGSWSR